MPSIEKNVAYGDICVPEIDRISGVQQDSFSDNLGSQIQPRGSGDAYDDNDDEDSHTILDPLRCPPSTSSLNLSLGKFCYDGNEYSSEDECTDSSVKEDNFEDSSHVTSLEAPVTRTVSQIYDALASNNKLMLSLESMETELKHNLAKLREKSLAVRRMSEGKFSCSVDQQTMEASKILEKCSIPYFTDPVYYSACPPNEDYITKQADNELIMCNLPKFSNWSPNDKIKLIEAIKLVKQKRQNVVDSEIGLDKKTKCVIKKENGRLSTDLLEEHYDWETLAQVFDGKHSAEECRGMWINHIDPAIESKPFTKQEKVRLLELAEQYRKQDWDAIATALGTRRSALQCYTVYVKEFKGDAYLHWSEEENTSLKRLVKENQMGKYIDWHRVSLHLPGRDVKQITAHWKNVLDPRIKKGKFSDKENEQLVKGVRMYGAKYSKVARFLPNRTSIQIRDHFLRMRLSLCKGQWSREEDMALLHLVSMHGEGNWAAVAEHFVSPNRTRKQICSRYTTLKPWSSKKRNGYKCMVDYVNSKHIASKIRFGGHLGRNTKTKREKKSIDYQIEKFLYVNYVEERKERCPGSLKTSFVLTEEAVKDRANDTNRLLEMLGANVTIDDNIITQDVSISNHDKMVFIHMQKQSSYNSVTSNQMLISTTKTSSTASGIELTRGTASACVRQKSQLNEISEWRSQGESYNQPSTSTQSTAVSSLEYTHLQADHQELPGSRCIGDEGFLECVRVQPGTLSATANELTDSRNVEIDFTFSDNHRTINEVQVPPDLDSPHDIDAVTAHRDFLLPNLQTLNGLSTMLLDKVKTQNLESSNIEIDNEADIQQVIASEKLWMERLKTLFHYSILLPPTNIESLTRVMDEDEESRNKSSNEDGEQCESVEIELKKKVGRPRKRKRKMDDTDQEAAPKRKYQRTGKYSKGKNLVPRISLRNLSKKSESQSHQEIYEDEH